MGCQRVSLTHSAAFWVSNIRDLPWIASNAVSVQYVGVSGQGCTCSWTDPGAEWFWNSGDKVARALKHFFPLQREKPAEDKAGKSAEKVEPIVEKTVLCLCTSVICNWVFLHLWQRAKGDLSACIWGLVFGEPTFPPWQIDWFVMVTSALRSGSLHELPGCLKAPFSVLYSLLFKFTKCLCIWAWLLKAACLNYCRHSALF